MHQVPSTAEAGPMSYAIFQLARAHRACAASLLRELNLHPGQELLLMQLLDRDGQTQSELLEAVGLDHSTVSKSLRRMQEGGLLIRTPSLQDRRVMVVHLTPAGNAMRGPITNLWKKLEEASAQNISERQILSFVRTAHALTRAFNERT